MALNNKKYFELLNIIDSTVVDVMKQHNCNQFTQKKQTVNQFGYKTNDYESILLVWSVDRFDKLGQPIYFITPEGTLYLNRLSSEARIQSEHDAIANDIQNALQKFITFENIDINVDLSNNWFGRGVCTQVTSVGDVIFDKQESVTLVH